MGGMNYQLGFVDEVTFATALAVSRFAEYNAPAVPIKGMAGRTEGNPLRGVSRSRRQARTIPYFDHAEGTLSMDLMNKGFGFWFKHMMPNVVASGAGPFIYTATEGPNSSALTGKSFTCQMNAPFTPTGTDQAVTFSGGKVPKWTLACDVDGMLTVDLDVWFATMTTATALATVAYPTNMTNFSWAGGVIQIGGSAVDVTKIAIEVDQGYSLDRGFIRGNTTKKEPVPGKLSGTFSIEADFESLVQWNRVHSTTVSGMSAAIVGTWTNGADIITATMPAARFDDISLSGDEGESSNVLTGVMEYDGSASPITLVYTTTDATA